MNWKFLALAAAAYLGMMVVAAVLLVWNRRQRSVFVAGLSPAELEWLRAFETFKGSWRDFRELRLRNQESPIGRWRHPVRGE
jgi:hypothetical protein